MPIFTIDKRKVSYEEYGSGPVALLIHASPGNAKAWTKVGEKLADRYHVIAPDLPGYGETTPQSTEDVPDVAYASELIEALICKVEASVVLAGHSYGGVVALSLALRGNINVGALVLFEPVAMKILPSSGETEAFAMAKTVFDDYIASFEGGDDRAVRKMIDFWFGQGAFDQMPESLANYLIKETAANIKDVRATFLESYSHDALQRLQSPVSIIVGDQSPDITHKIARAIAAHVPLGSVTKLKKANHALITTHVDEVAQAIARKYAEILGAGLTY